MQYFWLLIAHLTAGLLWFEFCQWEAKQNARLIDAAGTKPLGFWWHVGRTAFRLAVAVGLAATPLLVYPKLLPSIGLLVLLIGWFLYYFTPALNRLRGKPKYYVSFAETTSLFDRLLAKLARRRAEAFLKTRGTATDKERLAQQNAPRYLKTLLLAGFGLSIAVYVSCAIALAWLPQWVGAG